MTAEAEHREGDAYWAEERCARARQAREAAAEIEDSAFSSSAARGALAVALKPQRLSNGRVVAWQPIEPKFFSRNLLESDGGVFLDNHEAGLRVGSYRAGHVEPIRSSGSSTTRLPRS